jgi:hypothetical protein
MAKSVDNEVIDALLNYVINNAGDLAICEGAPDQVHEALLNKGANPGGKRLGGEVGITSGDFTGPVDGDTNGRKYTCNQQAGITIDVTGTADHIALSTDSSPNILLVVTSLSASQAVTSGNTATVNAWDHEVADPT